MATLTNPARVDPYGDAQSLRNAFQEWRTDDKASGLIKIISHRNAAQRRQIEQEYEKQYGHTLIGRFEREFSGNLVEIIRLWMLDPADQAANLANEALKNLDYRVVIELSCIPPAREILKFKEAYQARFKRSWEEDVASRFSGNMRKLLFAVASVHRCESKETDKELVKAEAKVLYRCIKDENYTDDEFVRILTTRSKAQLFATFCHFKDVFGKPITSYLPGTEYDANASLDLAQGNSSDGFKFIADFGREFFRLHRKPTRVVNVASDQDKDYREAINTTIQCIKSPQKYLAKVLSDAFKKLGTDEDALSRVVVTRAEKDLAEIKDIFYKRNSMTLEQAVAKETSGDYRKFILALLGHEGH